MKSMKISIKDMQDGSDLRQKRARTLWSKVRKHVNGDKAIAMIKK